MDELDYIARLSRSPQHIRSFCMLAHVDHGKTSLSDYLLSSSGLLSQSLAGKVRYLDSRPDEQERLITMKASAVALHHCYQGQQYLMNLVDSPGHIDFSCEVSTAMRLCDGAFILVDVIDGMTSQTALMLRHAFREGIRMVLVINKVDLLIEKLQLSPEEAYLRMREIITSCNAALAAYVASLQISSPDDPLLATVSEDEVWFCPSRGDVIFTSCFDGWGFSLRRFADIYAAKLGMPLETLNDALWGDFFASGPGQVSTKPKKEGQPPLAVTLMLQPLWTIYNTFNATPFSIEEARRITSKIGVAESVWNQARKDRRQQLAAVMEAFLPLAATALDAAVLRMPSPVEGNAARMKIQLPGFARLPKALQDSLTTCDNSTDAPVVVFIAKVTDVDNLAGAAIGEGGSDRRVTEDDLVGLGRVYSGRLRRGAQVYVMSGPAAVAAAAAAAVGATNSSGDAVATIPTAATIGVWATVRAVHVLRGRGLEEVDEVTAGCVCGVSGLGALLTKSGTLTNAPELPPFAPMALASSSILRLAVSAKDPTQMPQLLRGTRLLNQVDGQVELATLPTGEHVVCCAGEVHAERCMLDLQERFARVAFDVSEPLVSFRETVATGASTRLRPATVSTPNGAFTVSIAVLSMPPGALELISKDDGQECTPQQVEHLRRVMAAEGGRKWADLLDRGVWAFGPRRSGHAGCFLIDGTGARLLSADDSTASTPASVVTRAGGAAHAASAAAGRSPTATGGGAGSTVGAAKVFPTSASAARLPHCDDHSAHETPNQAASSSVSASVAAFPTTPLPEHRGNPAAPAALSSHGHREAHHSHSGGAHGDDNDGEASIHSGYSGEGGDHTNAATAAAQAARRRDTRRFADAIVSGFQLATGAGPIAEEPMYGMVFVVTGVEFKAPAAVVAATQSAAGSNAVTPSSCVAVSGTGACSPTAAGPPSPVPPVVVEDSVHVTLPMMHAVAQACRQAMLLHPRRLVEPVYEAVVTSAGATQGKIYAILSRCRSDIVDEVLHEGSDIFHVVALVPVAASFGLQLALRDQTHGAAQAQLRMSHWAVLDVDPYFKPTTKEEIEEFGDGKGGAATHRNIAMQLVERVRRRKGIHRENTIADPEKQKFSVRGA